MALLPAQPPQPDPGWFTASHVVGLLAAILLVIAFLLAQEAALRLRRRNDERKQRESWQVTEAQIRDAISEHHRVQVLPDIKVRAMSRQQELNQICRFTASAVEAPAAVITMVTGAGQEWLANSGSDWCAELISEGADEEDLTGSYCKITVATEQPLIVSESLDDIRLVDVRSNVRHKVRAYIGVPVRSQEGIVVGSLCVFDSRPRTWTDQERAVVSTYAAMVTL